MDVKGLYRGVGLAATATVPAAVFYLCMYHTLRDAAVQRFEVRP